MRLLDLFCGGGGAAMGYHRAGFDVVGVDIAPQPHYPFEFVQADAIEFINKYGKGFDIIHASPPCQAYSVTKSLTTKQPPDLVEITRKTLKQAGKPYIIENVPGSPLINPLLLCGTMFGLKVIRHRLFEIWPVQLAFAPASCCHVGKATGSQKVGKIGTRTPSLSDGFNYVTVAGNNYLSDEGKLAMGIDWLPKSRLSQAIPPAYTEWIGRQIL